MRNGYVYTIIFMLVISAVFTALLAGANAYYLPTINQNNELAQKKSILYVLGMEAAGGSEETNRVFNKSIKKIKFRDSEVYARLDSEDKISGYAVPFTGPGLWGTIKGYMGVSGDLKTLLGVDFTAQSETPGLGGRIDERWYKEQFRGLKVGEGKEITYGAEGEKQVDAVTGATITSNSVLKILNSVVENDLPELEVKE